MSNTLLTVKESLNKRYESFGSGVSNPSTEGHPFVEEYPKMFDYWPPGNLAIDLTVILFIEVVLSVQVSSPYNTLPF